MSELPDHDSSADAYDPAAFEPRWQRRWRSAGGFRTPQERVGRPSSYVLVSCPFTSGAAHMGHVRSYSIGDAFARYRRARGEAVLFSIGFDAFGLPAELGAITHGMSPRAWVDDCVARMRDQFDRLGFSFDWSRVFSSCDEDIYRWSQWLFLRLLEAGLIYEKEATVAWCPACDTVLARSQADGGECWRCHGSVRLVRRKQWFLRVSAYNDENFGRLEGREAWNRGALAGQHSVLGRVEGTEIEVTRQDGRRLAVFRLADIPDDDPAFVMLSPDHPEAANWTDGPDQLRTLSRLQADGPQREGRGSGDALLLRTTQTVRVGGAGPEIPVVISPSVDTRFGPTAVFGVPSVDRTHAAVAEQLGPMVVHGEIPTASVGGTAVRYSSADFPVSRQRAWGAPIPLVHCPGCGTVPVPLDQLPVRLPDDMVVTGAGNALAEHPSFAACDCPSCGQPARRETDTLDCHFDASWQQLPLAVPAAERAKAMFDHPELRRWLPVSRYVQGADAEGFVLDQRMVAKALRDLGVLEFLHDGEPYEGMLTHEMVQFDGRKMSKHIGNVVSPQALVEAVGADAVRFAVLYAAAPAKTINWQDQVLAHGVGFLRRLWGFAGPRLMMGPQVSAGEACGSTAGLALICEHYRSRITEDYEGLNMHRAARNVSLLLTQIERYEQERVSGPGGLAAQQTKDVRQALLLLIRLAAPIVPHVAEELWRRADQDGLLADMAWPEAIETPLGGATAAANG